MWLVESFTLLFAHVVNITDTSIPSRSASLIQCSYTCIKQIGCSSFFYSRKKQVCLVSTKRYLESNGLAVDTQYAYFIGRQGVYTTSPVSHARPLVKAYRTPGEYQVQQCVDNPQVFMKCHQSNYIVDARIPNTCSDCPLGFDKQGSSCYFFSTWNATYYNATKICSRLGGHLAAITSKEEDDALRNYARTQGKAEHYIIGATDLRQEGTWLWENPLRAMTYSNWAVVDSQPDDKEGNEDCLELRKSFSSYRWNDLPCTYSGNFICEIEL